MTDGLTAQQAEVWAAYRRMNIRLMAGLDRQLARDAGMPQGYYAILATLAAQSDRRLLLSDLARRCNFSQSRLSHAIARMEESGWVRREQVPTNRRSAFAVLTTAGARVRRAAAAAHDAEVKRLVFEPLSAEQARQLGAICAIVGEHIGAPEKTGDQSGEG